MTATFDYPTTGVVGVVGRRAPAPYKSTYPTQSAYQSALADRVREQLFEMLGPECAECGCDLRGVAWEVNHIYRREWVPRKLSKYRRNLRYLREAREGLVNAMCAGCNRGYRPKPAPVAGAQVVEGPF